MSSFPIELPECDIAARSMLSPLGSGVELAPDRNALASYLQASMEAERLQLVRDLHDDMGGLVVGALMDIAWVEAHLRPSDDVQVKLQRARQSLRAAIDLKRRLIEDMRPTLLDNVGLFAALKWHFVRLCDRSKIAGDTAFASQEPKLTPEAAISVFRMLQEALTLLATRLHATSIHLDAEAQDATLCLQLLHDGRAISHPDLANLPEFESMAHRIARLQGSLTITPAADGLVTWCMGVPIERPG